MVDQTLNTLAYFSRCSRWADDTVTQFLLQKYNHLFEDLVILRYHNYDVANPDPLPIFWLLLCQEMN